MTDEQLQQVLDSLGDLQQSNSDGMQAICTNLDFIVKLGLIAFVTYITIKILWRFLSPIVYD